MLFSPKCILTFLSFFFFVKSQVAVGIWAYTWDFHSIPLTNMSVLMPVQRCFYYYSSYSMISEEVQIKIRSVTLLDSKTREIHYILETWEVRNAEHCGLWGGKNRGPPAFEQRLGIPLAWILFTVLSISPHKWHKAAETWNPPCLHNGAELTTVLQLWLPGRDFTGLAPPGAPALPASLAFSQLTYEFAGSQLLSLQTQAALCACHNNT